MFLVLRTLLLKGFIIIWILIEEIGVVSILLVNKFNVCDRCERQESHVFFHTNIFCNCIPSSVYVFKQSSGIQCSSLLTENRKFIIQFKNIQNTASTHAIIFSNVLNQIFIAMSTFTHKLGFLMQYF